MHPLQRAVVAPQAKATVRPAARRRIFRDCAPWASGAQHVHHVVRRHAPIDPPHAAVPLGGRRQRIDMPLFCVRQIARTAQCIAVVERTVFGFPHRAPHESTPQRIITESRSSSGTLSRRPPNHMTRKVPGGTLNKDWDFAGIVFMRSVAANSHSDAVHFEARHAIGTIDCPKVHCNRDGDGVGWTPGCKSES